MHGRSQPQFACSSTAPHLLMCVASLQVGSVHVWEPGQKIAIYDLGFTHSQLSEIMCWQNVEVRGGSNVQVGARDGQDQVAGQIVDMRGDNANAGAMGGSTTWGRCGQHSRKWEGGGPIGTAVSDEDKLVVQFLSLKINGHLSDLAWSVFDSQLTSHATNPHTTSSRAHSHPHTPLLHLTFALTLFSATAVPLRALPTARARCTELRV